MKKKPLAFAMFITPQLVFAVGNIVLSLRKQMPREDYDVIIFYLEMSPQDIAIFKSIPRCRLIQYQFPAGMAETLLTKTPQESRFRGRYGIMCFARFESFALLAEYRTVVALDVDIAIQGNLAEMTQFGPFAITTDSPWEVQINFSAPIPGYQMNIPGVCTAVMVVHDSLPYQAMHQWCHFKVFQLAPFLINADQGIINLMLQEFRITPQLMPLETWQCISWREEANLAKIVHFGTEKKIWLDENLCNAFPEWYRIHREWLKLGGSDFDQSRIRPRNILSVLNEANPRTDSPAVSVAIAQS